MHVSQVEFLHKTKELNIVHNVEVLALYGVYKRMPLCRSLFYKRADKASILINQSAFLYLPST